jgi:transcription initiation factor TFIID subunit TAF12
MGGKIRRQIRRCIPCHCGSTQPTETFAPPVHNRNNKRKITTTSTTSQQKQRQEQQQQQQQQLVLNMAEWNVVEGTRSVLPGSMYCLIPTAHPSGRLTK